ncbi:hypothetical protein [Pseudoalteromonas phenolica]|nr:hypothetical protein [Pseudoalteromonas phenolica]
MKVIMSIHSEERWLKLSNNGKHKYLKFFGVLCIVFGVVNGIDAINFFNDPHAYININGVDRNDNEAKLLAFFFPLLMLIVGIFLNLVSFEGVSKANKARDNFWLPFRK